AYDLYLSRVTQIYASLDGYIGQKLTLSLDYDFYQPTFDADSIWNFFAGEPMNDFGVRANLDATDKLSLAAGGHARVYNVETAPINDRPSTNISTAFNPNYYPSNGTPFDAGGNLSARYRWGEGVVGVRSSANFGSGGDRAG